MRAFVGIAVADELADAIGRLQAMLPVGRQVPQENLHLTLAFLDDQPEERLEELHYRLEAIRAAPFELGFAGLGTFGGDLPRVVFADVAPSAALADLQRRVVSAARQAGIAPEARRFHPHVTLARLRPGAGVAARIAGFLADHGGAQLPSCPVTAFTLYRSDLHPGGARYEELARYDLLP